ncbi:hypothetical protein LPB140_10390 [Sphingorhabdus lutea]|uniref:Type II toxin-antitoxin system RelE/ParE family toxin n=1 Tax=Sphingorhabdus lutea TaxID=1913578 RepID=A0A1L3JDB7_9SPHN|nr:type II toxin-antitoxin system RelE/ParE family toxin [Sphingorhabdus lutea]APG63126.1 hypothetical protein LPB140_10390 [Sphingorhabdus lutea]
MNDLKRIRASFFENENGNMPVREWLLELSDQDRKTIGVDIATAEFGWPIGMPLCRSIKGRKGIWEIRSDLSDKRIGRVFFCVEGDVMVLLHGIIKKSQKTPTRDLDIAEKRKKGLTS